MMGDLEGVLVVGKGSLLVADTQECVRRGVCFFCACWARDGKQRSWKCAFIRSINRAAHHEAVQQMQHNKTPAVGYASYICLGRG